MLWRRHRTAAVNRTGSRGLPALLPCTAYAGGRAPVPLFFRVLGWNPLVYPRTPNGWKTCSRLPATMVGLRLRDMVSGLRYDWHVMHCSRYTCMAWNSRQFPIQNSDFWISGKRLAVFMHLLILAGASECSVGRCSIVELSHGSASFPGWIASAVLISWKATVPLVVRVVVIHYSALLLHWLCSSNEHEIGNNNSLVRKQ
jgi:hypothetical protein